MSATLESNHVVIDAPTNTGGRTLSVLSPRRFNGIYLLLIMVVVFMVWVEPFRTLANFRVVASGQAITGILTMGLIVSLISGVFDISIAAVMSFSISLVGWLQATLHMNAALAVVLTIACGALVGGINAFNVTVLKVDPIIATLGMSAILAAAAYWLAQGKTILNGISETFTSFGTSRVFSIPVPVFYLFGVALVLWFALEHTTWGRYLRAAGANPVATRLAGIRVVRLQWSALLVSGSLGALAGVVLTMQLGAASFDAGAPYLLPAFAAAFLGTTQIQPGRFNVWGTVVALYLLAVAVKGLQLRYPSVPWIGDFIQGVTLIGSVAIASYVARRRQT
jgi:ribose transport system permease protein